MTVHTSSLVVLLTVAVAVVACGDSGGGLEVTDSRIGVPTGPNAALYFTVVNDSEEADALEGASTDVAGAVEIHETSTTICTTRYQLRRATIERTTSRR